MKYSVSTIFSGFAEMCFDSRTSRTPPRNTLVSLRNWQQPAKNGIETSQLAEGGVKLKYNIHWQLISNRRQVS